MVTLDCISNWDQQPGEVIVVLPKGTEFTIPPDKYRYHLRVLVAADIGQVRQRIHGFAHADFDFVLQLDDDLLFDYSSYCELQKVLDMHADAAASPIFFDMETGECIFKAPGNSLARFKDVITSLIVGADRWPAKMGRISRAGIPYGVNRDCMTSDYLEVAWQSGGCVLHHRRNLVLSNYYPFAGRAGLEDLFHSFLLKSKGLKLIICKNAACRMESVRCPSSLKSVLREYEVLREYVRLAGLSIGRLRIWLLFSVFRVFLASAVQGRNSELNK